MNINSEQLDYLGTVIEDQDQPLSVKELRNALICRLGSQFCSIKNILGRNVLVYTNSGQSHILLMKNVTYLGNPHPVFKKRIQIPDWWQEFCRKAVKENLSFKIHFIGVYHYEGNIVCVHFDKDKYLMRGLHNSSAHVYINDLYQGMTYGTFSKEDAHGNHITTIRVDKLGDFLIGNESRQPSLFDLFRQFNFGFPFGEWIVALNAIMEMHKGEWPNWRQTEWAGWFLEYKFNKFTIDNNCMNRMRHVCNKKEGELDFDIRFEEEDFYGDLKASDITHREAPGNDQTSFIECIYRYNKFWYIIYEHDTIKDKDKGSVQTVARNEYIRSVDPSYKKDSLSYSSRMKNSVKFVRMTIIELNKVNYRKALRDFNQGHQPDGSTRAPKFIINKDIIKNDNYAVFRYTYNQN